MNRTLDRSLVRFAVVGALAATLGLAACGRKAGLDPPPSSAIVPVEEPATPVQGGIGLQGAIGVGPAVERDVPPAAPATSQRKSVFLLDWLLN